MTMQPRRLPTNSIPWVASEQRSELLPKVVYRGLHLRLQINHDNVSATGFSARSLCRLLPRLELVIDGQDTSFNLSGEQLYDLNRLDFSVNPFANIVTGNGSSQVSYVDLYLPISLTRALNPDDTMLDARKVTTIALIATWAPGSVVATSGVTVNSGVLSLDTDEYANADDQLQTGRHEIITADFPLNRIGQIDHRLEHGSNHQYRGLLIYTRNASGVLSNGLITGVRVRSRTFTYFSMDAQKIHAQNQREHSIVPENGVYRVNFLRDGKGVHRIDARNLSELIVEVDSTVNDGLCSILRDKSIFL